MDAARRDHETEYEKKQKSKPLVRWLHSFRYKHLVSIVREISEAHRGRPVRIVEVGCAHARLFDLLDPLFEIEYVGIELAEEFAAVARDRHGDRPNFEIVNAPAQDVLRGLDRPDLVVALETMEHIPERNVVRIVEAIADLKPALFVCSVPVEIGPVIWFKNVGSMLIRYDRRGKFGWSDLVETFWASCYQVNRLPLHKVGHTGFDWRWLGQTIRHNMRIREIRTLPLGFLPAGLATNVMFLAEPRNPTDEVHP